MKIGVLSDTHDRIERIEAALKLFAEAQVGAICHAGDFVAPFAAKCFTPDKLPANVPFHCIYGNNDGEKEGLRRVLTQIVGGPLRVTLGGRRVVMAHSLDWLGKGDAAGCDIVIGGHTHGIVNETRNGQLWLNPGEACAILGQRATVAIVDTEDLSAEIHDIT